MRLATEEDIQRLYGSGGTLIGGLFRPKPEPKQESDSSQQEPEEKAQEPEEG